MTLSSLSGSRESHGGTLAVSWGAWGGFYWNRGYALRLCLGRLALTYIPRDLDPLLMALESAHPPVQPTLEGAVALAARAHDGQQDKGGEPYILHALRVMLRMRTEEERIVAVLHDALEDGPDWVRRDLAAFPERIVQAVEALTRRKPEEEYMAYIRRAGANPLARTVKLADIRDNLDPTRKAPDKERLVQRYLAALMVLKAMDEPEPADSPGV